MFKVPWVRGLCMTLELFGRFLDWIVFPCLFVGSPPDTREGLGATLLVGLSTVLGRIPAIETLHGTGTRLRCRNPREDPEYSGETNSESV